MFYLQGKIGIGTIIIVSNFLSRALHHSYTMPDVDFVDRSHTNITDTLSAENIVSDICEILDLSVS